MFDVFAKLPGLWPFAIVLCYFPRPAAKRLSPGYATCRALGPKNLEVILPQILNGSVYAPFGSSLNKSAYAFGLVEPIRLRLGIFLNAWQTALPEYGWQAGEQWNTIAWR